MKPRPSDSIEIDIDIRNTNWQLVDNLEILANTCIMAAWEQYCPRAFSEISLLFTDNAQVQELNNTYRGQDKPTNVLSFPTSANIEIPILGDVILAFETVEREAREQDIALADHITHLLVHGYLHLQGLDHMTNADALVMEALEIKVLADLGISNPYGRDEL